MNLRAIGTAVLIHVGVGLHVGVEHALVDTTVVTIGASERLGALIRLDEKKIVKTIEGESP